MLTTASITSWSMLSAGRVFDEFAVDLDVVEREVFEVVEGAEAGAEVIEREAAAVVAEVLREGLGVGDVGDGGGFGDFEDQVGRIAGAGSQPIVDRLQERGVAEGFAGDVDLELEFGVLFDQFDRVACDPFVDLARSSRSVRRCRGTRRAGSGRRVRRASGSAARTG